MYQKILVALENRKSDEGLLPHVEQLAKLTHAQLLLLHVADGWVARNFNQLKLAESQEMREDREYLERTAERLRAAGIEVSFASRSAIRRMKSSRRPRATIAISSRWPLMVLAGLAT